MTGFNVNQVDTGKKWPQYIAALAATGGALAAGTALAWTSPTQSKIETNSTDTTGEYPFHVSSEAFSWVSAVVTLGAAAVCFPIGALANTFGRKWTMLGLVIPFTVGWALVIWAQNLAMLLIGRFLLGVGGGAFCVTAPMYTGEIAQKEVRGSLGTYFQLMITVGILFVYCVGAGTNVFWLSVICGIIPLIFGVIFFFMPESPTYLVEKKNHEAALKALEWLRGKDYDSKRELDELEYEIESEVATDTDLLHSLRRIPNLKAMLISVGLMFFQQASGINAVIFYTVDIFNATDSELNPIVASIIVGSMQSAATLVSSMIVDKLGRKILLLISAFVMCLCLFAIGLFFYLQEQGNDTSEIGWLPVTSMCVYIIVFSLGFGPVPWIMSSELFAPDVKGFLAPLAGTVNWLLAFTITKFFTNLVSAIKRGPTFWLFSGFCAVSVVFVMFVVPETKGKSLLEIQAMLAGEKYIEHHHTQTENKTQVEQKPSEQP